MKPAPANPQPPAIEAQLRQAMRALESRLEAGEGVRAEEYLLSCPELSSSAETAVDLIYAEYARREELGQPVEIDEYLRRFPQYSQELARQFAVHQALKEMDQAQRQDASVTNQRGQRIGQYVVERRVGRGFAWDH